MRRNITMRKQLQRLKSKRSSPNQEGYVIDSLGLMMLGLVFH
jgi:hypothetical protein